MFKILSTYSCWKKMYKMQHLEGSGTPVLYIGRTVNIFFSLVMLLWLCSWRVQA